MLELLMLGLCFGSQMNSDACTAGWIKYKQQNPGIDVYTKDLERKYFEPLPEDLKVGGGAAYTVFKRDVKFGICRGTYIEIKNTTLDNQGLIGYKFSF